MRKTLPIATGKRAIRPKKNLQKKATWDALYAIHSADPDFTASKEAKIWILKARYLIVTELL